MLAFTLSATVFIGQPRDAFNDTWSGTRGWGGGGGGAAESREAALSMSLFLEHSSVCIRKVNWNKGGDVQVSTR